MAIVKCEECQRRERVRRSLFLDGSEEHLDGWAYRVFFDKTMDRIGELEDALQSAEEKLANSRAKLIEVSCLLQDAIEGNYMPSMVELDRILSDIRKPLAVFSVPKGYTLLTVANDKDERIVFGEIQDDGTVIVMPEEEG